MILAGNVDVPKAFLRIVNHEKDEHGKNRLSNVVAEAVIESSGQDSLAGMVREFLSTNAQFGPIYSVIISVNGPVGEKGAVANIQRPAWGRTKAAEIAEVLPAAVPVIFLNDMEAMGYGVFSGGSGDDAPETERLSPGKAVEYQSEKELVSKVLFTVGGGFGQAFWVWNPRRNDFDVFASEGGHSDFAPRNDIEIQLLTFLLTRNSGQPVSYEQVLSAGGIEAIYDFLSSRKQAANDKDNQGANEIISRSDNNTDATAVEAVDLFCEVLGAEAGNAALRYRPTRGVYLAGGLVPALLPSLRRGKFMDGFLFKEGIFAEENGKVPVTVTYDKSVSLRGAAARGLPLLTRGYWVYRRQAGLAGGAA